MPGEFCSSCHRSLIARRVIVLNGFAYCWKCAADIENGRRT